MDLIKCSGQTFKDVDPVKRIVTGYFSSFDTKDDDGDIIRKGAYAKTILENGPGSPKPRIKHLLDHIKTYPASVLQVLLEDNFGLYYEGLVGTHTEGEDFLKMARDGYITEHSVHIFPVKQSHSATLRANEIFETKLREGSSMRFLGANSDTPFMGLKGAKDLHSMFEWIEKALKTADYSDEAFIKLEAQYTQIGELLKATQPVKTTEPEESQKPKENLLEIFKNAAFNGN